MACFHPLKGYRSKDLNPSGKRSIVFNPTQAYRDVPVELGCGQCIGCRLDRSLQWALRITHEASQYDRNCFLTLTYDDAHCPKNGSLELSHFQKFMKKLRFHNSGVPIRFFHCGEYGDQFHRPHYHACIFNFDFDDKIHWQTTNGEITYTSEKLTGLWEHGFSLIGSLTFKSAAYVARYITKKITGERASWYYNYIDEDTGEEVRLKPEYTTMSRRPGIGKNWFDNYRTDVFPKDFITVNGKKYKIPRFYNTQMELHYPSDYAKTKAKRQVKAKQHIDNNTPARLQVREEVQLEQFERLKRSYETK